MQWPQVWKSAVRCQELPGSLGLRVCQLHRSRLCKNTGVNTSPWTALGKPLGLRSSTLLLPLQQSNFPACPTRKPNCAYPGWSPCENPVKRAELCAWHSSPTSCHLKQITAAEDSHYSSPSQHNLPVAEVRSRVERSSLTRSLTVRTESLHQSHRCTIRSLSLGKGLD